jgi:hypothetical protein
MEEEKEKKGYDFSKDVTAEDGDSGINDADPDERRRIETQAAFDNLRERIARAQADLERPANRGKFPHQVLVPHEPLTRPTGDAAHLLERQLASAAALVDYLAHFIARPDTDPQVCISFMNNMTSLLGANAQIGKVVGHLRGQVSESRQTISVEKRMIGGRGEGVLES